MIESEKVVSYTIVSKHRLIELDAKFPENGQYEVSVRVAAVEAVKESGDILKSDVRTATLSAIQLEQIFPGTLQMCQELADKITRAIIDGKIPTNGG